MEDGTKRIDLYLISGFLGSGKTTFIRRILTESHRRTGVIINEFGSISIDGPILAEQGVQLVEINNGSIFCACLKGGFVKTLAAFLAQPIERLYVEASGMADPSSMEELLTQITPLLRKKFKTDKEYKYCGSICIADAGNFLDLSESILPVVAQVEKSNLIILNKVDEVSQEGQKQVMEELRNINDRAFIYPTNYAQVPEDILRRYLNGEGEVQSDTYNTMQTRPFGGVLTMPDSCSRECIELFLSKISSRFIRVKGFVSVCGDKMHVDCVAQQIQIEQTTIADGRTDNKLVLIGKTEENLAAWLEEQWNQYFDIPMQFEEE